ncbi:MAG: polysaccharide biosynthesis C-terminal domain-containing protein [Thermanaerothrix sp.]|nr:polysaccharide biosynthesis C-terminal domain-containing protein [Thermanaerothrix sp.]
MSVFFRIGRFISKVASVKSARGASLLILALTLLSKPVGYARMLVLAWFFGASVDMDGYNMAFGLTSLFMALFIVGVESAVLPVASRLLVRDEARARSLMGAVVRLVFLGAVLGGALLYAFRAPVIGLFAPGFDPKRAESASYFMGICALFLVFKVAASPLEAWAMAQDRYVVPHLVAGAANLLSFLVLVGGVAAGLGIPALGLSVVFNGVLSFVLLLPAVRDYPLLIGGRPEGEDLREALGLFLPCLVLNGVFSLYTFVDRYFASMLPVGGVTHLYYSGVMFSAAGSLFSSSAMMFLVKASKAVESGGSEDQRRMVEGTSGLSVAYIFPVGAALFAGSLPLVRLLFGHGSFKWEDVIATGACLGIFSWALPFYVLNTVFFRAAQASGGMGRVLMVVVPSLVFNALLDFLFWRPFGVYGIVLATSLAIALSSFLYGRVLLGSCGLGVPWRFAAPHVAFSLLWGVPLGMLCWKMAGWGIIWSAISLMAVPLALCLHFYVLDKVGLYNHLSHAWRPSEILRLIMGAASR